MNFPLPFTPLDEYKKKFARVKFSRTDGVLTVTLHKDNGEFSWSLAAHREISTLWNYIGMDPENKVIIITGTGKAFLDRTDYELDTLSQMEPMTWALLHQDAKKIVMDLVEIEQPIICALNGPVSTLSQIPMLCDIILATPEATISEALHLPHMIPGDGHHIVWPLLLGLNRAKYLIFTRKALSAREALEERIVSEIVDRENLLPRANELARQLLEVNPVALRYLRPVMMQSVKRALLDGVSMGLLAEGYAALRRVPAGPQLGLPQTH